MSKRKPKKAVDILKDVVNPIKGKTVLESVNEEALKDFQELSLASDIERGQYSSQFDEVTRLAGTTNVKEGVDYSGMLAASQPFGEQLGNFALGGAKNFAAGLLDNFNYDVPDMAAMIAGQERSYGSWLSEITKDLRDSAEDNPIYQEGHSFSDPAYWFNQLKNTAYSGGLITGSLLEQLALSSATAATLGASSALQAASLSRKVSLLPNLLFGAGKGVHEGYINGLETFNSTKERYLDLGYDLEEAEKQASKAAAIGYRMEVGPLMILNALQFGTIGKYNPFSKKGQGLNLGYSGAIESIVEKVLPRIGNRYARGAVKLAFNSASEALEEGIQTGISKYAQHKTLVDSKDLFSDLEIYDQEMIDSMVGGALGGTLFSGFGSISERVSKKAGNKAFRKLQENFISQAQVRAVKDLTELKEAFKEGDPEKIQRLKDKMQKSNVIESLTLDYINDNENSFEAYVGTLEQLLEAVKNQDTDLLKTYGISSPEDIALVQEAYPQYIKDAKQFKTNFVAAYEKFGDFDTGIGIADTQAVFDTASRYITHNAQILEEIKVSSTVYQELSPEGKAYFDQYAKVQAYENTQGKDSSKYAEESVKLAELKKEAGKDSKYVETWLKYNDVFSKIETEIEALHGIKEQAIERLGELSDPKNIVKRKREKALKKIKEAKTVEKLEEAKESLKEIEEVPEEVEEAVNVEIEKLEAEEVTSSEVIDEFGVITPTENEERQTLGQEIIDTDKATVIPDEDLEGLFAIWEEDPVSESRLNKSTPIVKDYVESLKFELGREPSFEEFLQDFITQTDKKSTQNIFNVLVESWKALGYKEDNFSKVYDKVFRDRGSLAKLLIENKEEAVTLEEDVKKDPVVETKKQVASNEKEVRNQKESFETSDAGFKAAYQSVEYNREVTIDEQGNVVVDTQDVGDDLHYSKTIQSHLLLHPDYVNAEEVLTVRIPEGHEDLQVSQWEDAITKKAVLSFSSWLKVEGVEEGSEEWINKVPLVAYNSKGEPLFYIHDTEWYNPINVGFKEDPRKQAQVILEARKNLARLRKQVVEKGSLSIEITEKRPGTFKLSDNEISLNEANPETLLATVNFNGDLEINGKTIPTSDKYNIVNKKEVSVGHAYELRRGVNSNDYIALKAHRENLDENSQETLAEIIRLYLNKHNLSDQDKKLAAQIKDISGLDPLNSGQVTKLVKHYAIATFAKSKNSKDRVREVQKKVLSKIPVGKGFLMFNGDALIFGVKGEKFANKDYVRLHPLDTANRQQSVETSLRYLKEKVLPTLTQNMSRAGLTENRTMFSVKDGAALPQESYREFLKSVLKTNIKSFNVGTAENPVYATYVQPRISFKIVGETVVEQEVAEEVAPEVEVSTEEAAEKELLKETLEALKLMGVKDGDDLIKDLKNDIGDTNEEVHYSVGDFMYDIQTSSELQFQLERGFPFSNQLIKNVEKGIQQITIRQKKFTDNNKPGLYKLNGKNYAVDLIGGKAINISYLLSKGKSIADILNAAGIKSLDTIKSKELLDWFEGRTERNVFFIKPLQEENNLFSLMSTEGVSGIKEQLTGVNGLTILQDYQLSSFIFNNILEAVDSSYGSSVSKGDILNKVRQIYKDIVTPIKEKNQALVENLTKLEAQGNTRLSKYIERLEKELEIFEIIENNWHNFEDTALKRVAKYSSIEEVINPEEQDFGIDRDFSKTSLEESGKQTSGYRLKRFLAGIKKTNSVGKEVKGFLNIPLYIGFDTAYDVIGQIISTPSEIPSSYSEAIKRLEDNVDTYPWLDQVIEGLQQGPQQLRHMFMYNFVHHALSMKFGMYSIDKGGNYHFKVYSTNANEIIGKIVREWESSLFNTSLVTSEDGVHKINTDRAKKALSKFNEWEVEIGRASHHAGQTVIPIKTEELRLWLLENFGISLSNETITELRQKNVDYITRTGKVNLSFERSFDKRENTAGIFGLLAYYLETIVDKENTEFEDNPDNHPFKNANNILKKLALIESKYSVNKVTTSFRDGKKSIYGYTATKHATDVVASLKESQEFRDKLKSKTFNRLSFILNLLENDEAFRSKFSIDHIGLTSLKELGKKVYKDTSVTKLSDSDQELLKLLLFQDSEQGQISSYADSNQSLELRMARLFFPTMSDKSQMLSLNTAVLNIEDSSFDPDTFDLNSTTLSFIYSQIVSPELNRILAFHLRGIKDVNSTKDYEAGAGIFNFIPELNNIIHTESGKRFISIFSNGQPSSEMLSEFETKAKEVLRLHIEGRVKEKMDSWLSYDFIEKSENGYVPKILDKKYLSKVSDKDERKVPVAAYDFVINSLIGNANIFMLVAGDPALYAKKGKLKKYFQKGNPILPKEQYGNTAYAEYIKNVVDTNVSKRLAAMLAPGKKLSNSVDSYYTQIFIADKVSHAVNLEFLTSLLDGKKITEKEINIIKAVNNAESLGTVLDTDVKKQYDSIVDKYPRASSYFSIESTDAQEYTTAREHVDVLWRQGRIEDSKYETIVNKLIKQSEQSEKGLPISEDNFLTYQELQTVFQPVKPVYTGFIEDQAADLMRMVYIKSSAFPLLPQLTQGKELDKLRGLIEKVERDTGKTVRASYQTANKVGAAKQPLHVFDQDGAFRDNISPEEIQIASLTLDRDNFRIQQDVPFKSSKTDRDTVSLGTQVLRLLFADGITELDGFVYNGENYTGKDLKKVFNSLFKEYVKTKKLALYEETGLNEEGEVTDKVAYYKNLQRLLVEEAEKRGYPKQDIAALALEEIKDSTGKVVDISFKIPLWLASNSNRYESLLNSIVSNRLARLKMPGASYVVASEAGFKSVEDSFGVDRIVYTSAWKGELQASGLYKDAEGNDKYQKIQVFVPSKFRNNEGELISFFNADGTPNETYVETKEDGSLVLKEGMIDSELLSLTSFRVPTSKHSSMTQVEIVGFLPTAVGDMMVVPNVVIQQKGLDFDVDKETTYHLNAYMQEDGKIAPLQEGEGVPLTWKEQHETLYQELSTYLDEILGEKKEVKERLNILNHKYKELIYTLTFIYDEIKTGGESDTSVDNLFKDIFGDKFSTQKELRAEIEFVKNSLNEIKRDQKESSKDLKELKFYVDELYKAFENQRDQIEGVSQRYKNKIQNKVDQKLLENEIIRIHSAVLTSTNPEVQKKIHSTISVDFAKSQAEMIDEKLQSTQDSSGFSILSDEHQKQVMLSGTSGKIGIGVYSNYLVFHGITQQEGENDFRLRQYSFEDKTHLDYGLTIGNITSKGKLGQVETLKPDSISPELWGQVKRTVIDVFAERQNTATDNQNEQIMGKVNINEITINVDSLLTMLGFDTDLLDNGEPVSIPYLLLSQPIIRDFVYEYRKTQSSTKEYDPEAKEKVATLLYEKYKTEDFDMMKAREQLTGQTLYDNLADPKNHIQTTVLSLFLELDNHARKISNLQSLLNSTTGLGKSFFDVINTKDQLQDFISTYRNSISGINISNIDSIIGKFSTINPDEEVKGSQVGTIAVETSTPIGTILVESVGTAYAMWKEFFPYDILPIKANLVSIVRETSGEDVSDRKTVEMYQEIFSEMKKYFYSSQRLGVFLGDPQLERKRLFIDIEEEGKQSLASYLSDLVLKDSPVKEMINSNTLISRLSFDVRKNGLPSLIKFDNTVGEAFDEDYLYLSLIELMDDNINLPDFNGEKYTTKDLAEDLISYAYLEGGIQKAIQFVKFIPVEYLNNLPFARTARSWNEFRNPTIFRVMLKDRFKKQYFQHNPQRLPQFEDSDMIEPRMSSKGQPVPFAFSLNKESPRFEELLEQDFIVQYDPFLPKGLKKYHIFANDGFGNFTRIDTLGVFGMSEYDIKEDDVNGIVSVAPVKIPAPTPVKARAAEKVAKRDPEKDVKDFFSLSSGSLVQVVSEISKSSHEGTKDVAAFILDHLSEVPVSVTNFEEKHDKKNARGVYIPSKNEIEVNSIYLNKSATQSKDVAQTIVHEALHSILHKLLDSYVTRDGKLKDPDNTPKSIEELVILYNKARRVFSKEVQELTELFDNNESIPPDMRVYYGLYDIQEFVVNILTEPAFQKLLAVKYESTSDTYYERFIKILKNILESFKNPDVVEGTLAYDSLYATVTLFDLTVKANKESQTKYEEMRQREKEAEDSLMSDFGKISTPDDVDIAGLNLGNVVEDTEANAETDNDMQIKANIPQNLVSGVVAFGTKQEANNKAKELLGENPHSIDMIEAGIRTRTTRSVGEMQKYNIKVGDVIKHFGKSDNGATKQVLAIVTAIHPKGTPEYFNTWHKEGWTAEGVEAIKRFKDGAAAIEFEIIKPENNTNTTKGTINVYWGQAESKTSTRILSNLAPRKFTYKGKEYGSVEHAYQSNKSGTFDEKTYQKYNEILGYGKKIRGKGTVAEMKAADSLGLMKGLVVESFKQNPNSEAAKKLMQYDNFTHNSNELIDKAFLEGLKLAQKELLKPDNNTNTYMASKATPERITKNANKKC